MHKTGFDEAHHIQQATMQPKKNERKTVVFKELKIMQQSNKHFPYFNKQAADKSVRHQLIVHQSFPISLGTGMQNLGVENQKTLRLNKLAHHRSG